jgi:hypothetical protein
MDQTLLVVSMLLVAFATLELIEHRVALNRTRKMGDELKAIIKARLGAQ